MTVKFDLGGFERAARQMGAKIDQVPYALARSLNDAADITRKRLVEDVWPSHVNARNKSFAKATLTTAGNRASKRALRVAIVDRLQHVNLVALADGGARTARGSNLAIPSERIRKGAHGVVKSQKPRALTNSFVRGDQIYQRVGKYTKGGNGRRGRDNRRLKLMYTLKHSVNIPKKVPLRETFQTSMRDEVVKAFQKRIVEAMATRRNR